MFITKKIYDYCSIFIVDATVVLKAVQYVLNLEEWHFWHSQRLFCKHITQCTKLINFKDTSIYLVNTQYKLIYKEMKNQTKLQNNLQWQI